MLKTVRLISVIFLLLLNFTAKAANPLMVGADLFYPTVNTIAGNPNGKISLVEFFDYRCSYCRKIPPIIDTLVKDNPDLKIIYRDYPVLGPESLVAAEAALAAQQQGKYLPLQAALIHSSKPLNNAVITELGQQAGLNISQLEKDKLSYLTQQQLRENRGFAQALEINTIPAIFIALTPMSGQSAKVEVYTINQEPIVANLQAIINMLRKPA